MKNLTDEVKLTIELMQGEINKLRAEAELLRMQLAACGVVAMANTPESANKARAMHPEYMSASCHDVMGSVDREMALRDQISRQAELIRKMAVAAEQVVAISDRNHEVWDALKSLIDVTKGGEA